MSMAMLAMAMAEGETFDKVSERGSCTELGEW